MHINVAPALSETHVNTHVVPSSPDAKQELVITGIAVMGEMRVPPY